MMPGKSHLTTLDILIELRGWLEDNSQQQAEPAIVAHLPNGYLTFAVQLHRFCHAPIPPHYTCELLRSLWWVPPADTTSTWAWRINRLVRLMMLANRRAVWHRYQLGRQQDHKEPHQHRSTKLSPLKPAHCYHQDPLTDTELVTLYKFTCSALYQSSEWSGGPEQVPRLVKVIQRLQQALAQDVLAQLSLWELAPWGEM